jgi:hypothetical protein
MQTNRMSITWEIPAENVEQPGIAVKVSGLVPGEYDYQKVLTGICFADKVHTKLIA